MLEDATFPLIIMGDVTIDRIDIDESDPYSMVGDKVRFRIQQEVRFRRNGLFPILAFPGHEGPRDA